MLTPLPIDAILPEVIAALRVSRVLVLVAPPGSGKTTRVPPAILRADLLAAQSPALVLLQPRRVAARAAASRIAEENGWRLGEEVGYQIRFEKRVGPRTRLRVETEGILNRRLVSDPFLDGVGGVILDEFHERSLHTDLAVAMLKEVRETVREDLILVVMSATLDAGPVSRFLGDCPVIQAEGRVYPVEISYRPTLKPASAESVAAAVGEALRAGDDAGHVLVFLPGTEEIRRAASQIPRRDDLEILPLHGSLSSEEQDRALRPCSRRKLILATNIAETSLTIDGVRTVIDTGLARFAGYDPSRGLDRLELGKISKASATQRAGRAGRTAPGRCIRLWSQREQRGLIDSDPAEVSRVDLAATLLALYAWGATSPARFGWFEAPAAERIDAAESLLKMLGALEGEPAKLTPLGRRLLAIPAHPRIGRLLIAASEGGHPLEGAAIAAILSEKDIAERARGQGIAPRGRGVSDVLARLDLLEEAEHQRFSPRLRDRGIDPAAARTVARVRDEFFRIAKRLHGNPLMDPPDESAMLSWILLAYPDRVVRRRGKEATGVMVGGRGIRLDPESVVCDDEFFLALDPREDRRGPGGVREARVRIASAIREEWLDEFFPHLLRHGRTVELDPTRQKVVAVTSLRFVDLLLREDRNAKVDPSESAAALGASLRPRALAFLQEDEAAANWLARLDFLRGAMPDADWPELDESILADILVQASLGKQTIEAVKRTPLVPLLKARLTHLQDRALDEHAPEAIGVPSGNRIRLAYETGRPPVLAVRLQELFGLKDTPRVAGGRVAVILHLLGPNYRPVQVTDDLRSFWATAYFQVRKDLRSRYPRHAWPDDPLTARAEARGGRRL